MKNDFKVAIMQPYFMPYIGYWQLINAVDLFVLFDDVNFIKKGWINRNRIINNKQEYTFVLPLKNVSQNRLINEHEFVDNEAKTKLFNLISNSYKKAPEWDNVKDLLNDVINYPTLDLVEYIKNSIEKICNYLGIETRIVASSDLDNNKELKAQDKIIDICKMLDAGMYINPSGGIDLYDDERFMKEGIDLRFIFSRAIEYKQYNNDFIPGLSFIDMLCFLDKEEIRNKLEQYDLVKKYKNK